MKKDIEVPKTEGVKLFAVRDYNEELQEEVWNIFLYNARETPMDTIMIVLRGYTDDKQTSVMRKTLDRLEAGSYARLEFLRAELLSFRNEYLVTFFYDGKLYEKNFLLQPGQVAEANEEAIENTDLKGIVIS